MDPPEPGRTATFVGAGHPLDGPLVVVVLAHREGEDPHLPEQESERRRDQTGDPSPPPTPHCLQEVRFTASPPEMGCIS